MCHAFACPALTGHATEVPTQARHDVLMQCSRWRGGLARSAWVRLASTTSLAREASRCAQQWPEHAWAAGAARAFQSWLGDKMLGNMPAQYKPRMGDALLFYSMHPNGEPLEWLGKVMLSNGRELDQS